MNKKLNIQKEIINAIQAHKEIVIFRHVRPDLDAVGSQFGLKNMIEATYPNKKVYTHGENVSWLSDLIAPMNPQKRKDFSNQLVIIVDTANIERIDGNYEKLKGASQIIKIDHHLPVEDYGDLQWVEPSYSSASEMIAKLWSDQRQELKMTKEGAYALYAGIVGDTNRFLYESTSPQTMQLAGELMKFGFDHASLHFKLAEISEVERRLIAYTLGHATVTKNGVGSIIFTASKLEHLGATDEDTSVAISLLGNIQGVISWGVFVEQPNGGFRCRLRSKGPAINVIAEKHEGGGHKLASGANAKNFEEIEDIIGELEQVNNQFKKI